MFPFPTKSSRKTNPAKLSFLSVIIQKYGTKIVMKFSLSFEKVTKKQIEEIFNSQKSATKNTASKKSKIDTSAAKENNKPVN